MSDYRKQQESCSEHRKQLNQHALLCAALSKCVFKHFCYKFGSLKNVVVRMDFPRKQRAIGVTFMPVLRPHSFSSCRKFLIRFCLLLSKFPTVPCFTALLSVWSTKNSYHSYLQIVINISIVISAARLYVFGFRGGKLTKKSYHSTTSLSVQTKTGDGWYKRAEERGKGRGKAVPNQRYA